MIRIVMFILANWIITITIKLKIFIECGSLHMRRFYINIQIIHGENFLETLFEVI
jgi:hypothetical protein